MFKQIDQIEAIPQDFDRALSFYTGVLGLNLGIRSKLKRFR